jgi:signal transduction histidine kinase
MRGEIEVAIRRPRSAEEYVDVLESTLEEVVRLSRIAEDLLTLARSDAHTLEPQVEMIDAVEVVSRMAERLRAKAEARDVRIELPGPLPSDVPVDPAVLGQIAWNLIDNAVTHAPSGGCVRIGLAAADGSLSVSVEDDGPGLGDLNPDLLFERFYRGDAVRSRMGEVAGTGLGLAIVRALARAHGGSVSAENLPAGGARFTAVLHQVPVQRNSAQV